MNERVSRSESRRPLDRHRRPFARGSRASKERESSEIIYTFDCTFHVGLSRWRDRAAAARPRNRDRQIGTNPLKAVELAVKRRHPLLSCASLTPLFSSRSCSSDSRRKRSRNAIRENKEGMRNAIGRAPLAHILLETRADGSAISDRELRGGRPTDRDLHTREYSLFVRAESINRLLVMRCKVQLAAKVERQLCGASPFNRARVQTSESGFRKVRL